MSDTPRTDKARGAYDLDTCVFAEDMEDLERELNAAKNIITDLLENPYPHDLIKIRKDAAGYTSEEYAAEDMEAYCTEEAALKARAEWKLAQEIAREFLKKQ